MIGQYVVVEWWSRGDRMVVEWGVFAAVPVRTAVRCCCPKIGGCFAPIFAVVWAAIGVGLMGV